MCCFPLVKKEAQGKKFKRTWVYRTSSGGWQTHRSDKSFLILSNAPRAATIIYSSSSEELRVQSWGHCAARQNNLQVDPNLLLPNRFSPLHKREEPRLSTQVSGFNAAIQWSRGLVTGTMHALGRRYSLTIFLGKQERENRSENYVSFTHNYLRLYCISVTYSF